MNIRTDLERLDDARPAVLHRTETVIDGEEEDRILDRILGSDRDTTGTENGATVRRSAIRSSRRVVGAAAAAFLLIAGALVVMFEGGRSPFTRHDHAAATGPSRTPHASTMKLVNYTFKLPSGFTTTIDPCAASGPGPATPVPVLEEFGAAASADGGCIEAFLSSSVTIPPGAQPVDVGPYQGYMATSGRSNIALYVSIPTADGGRYLVLLAQGLTSEQVLTIAQSAFPGSSPGPSSTCAAGCG